MTDASSKEYNCKAIFVYVQEYVWCNIILWPTTSDFKHQSSIDHVSTSFNIMTNHIAKICQIRDRVRQYRISYIQTSLKHTVHLYISSYMIEE